jgi:hypothetical protein
MIHHRRKHLDNMRCIQGNYGVCFKPRYLFTSDRRLMQGWQDFQDSSCIIPDDIILIPSASTYRQSGGVDPL